MTGRYPQLPSVAASNAMMSRPPDIDHQRRQWAKPTNGAQCWAKNGAARAQSFLFILAIYVMTEGVRDLGPLMRNSFHVTSPANALGFGWIFAYIVMSGSPVAVAGRWWR